MFSSEGRLGLIEHLVTGYVVLRGRADQVVLLTTLAAIREHATRLCENGTWCTLRTTRVEGPRRAARIAGGGIDELASLNSNPAGKPCGTAPLSVSSPWAVAPRYFFAGCFTHQGPTRTSSASTGRCRAAS